MALAIVDTLSQSQIDALLKSIWNSSRSKPSRQAVEQRAEAEETKHSRRDFYSPRKLTRERMKILTSVFESCARILTPRVSGTFHAMADITVLEAQEYRCYEYVNSLYEDDCTTLVDVYVQDKGKNNVPLVPCIMPGLVPTLINHMLGGGDEVVKVDTSYRYSDAEVALYRRVAGYYTQILKGGFSDYINMAFRVQRVGGNPSMMQDMGLGETVAIIHPNVGVAGLAVERVRLCLPGTLLEYIFYMIDNRKYITHGSTCEDDKDIILNNIYYTQFPTTGQLATVELDVSDIYHLKVGGVIDLNRPQNSKVRLFVGRQPWFLGEMGIYEKNIAVCIQDWIYGEPEGPLKMKELVSRELENQEDTLQRLGSSDRSGWYKSETIIS